MSRIEPSARWRLADPANLVAVIWGFAEATLFFLVPDVWLSYVTLQRNLRAALVACVWATAGAITGGVVMYGWGSTDPDGARALLELVPAVSAAMVERVATELERQGLVALFVGPFVGTPYKIYAVTAPQSGIGLWPFAVISVPARLARFVLVSLIVNWISRRWLANWSRRAKLGLVGSFWLAFYALFLLLMPG